MNFINRLNKNNDCKQKKIFDLKFDTCKIDSS